MTKIIQLAQGEELPSVQRWVLVKVVDRLDVRVTHTALSTTFHTTLGGLNATLTEASRYAEERDIPAVHVRLP